MPIARAPRPLDAEAVFDAATATNAPSETPASVTSAATVPSACTDAAATLPPGTAEVIVYIARFCGGASPCVDTDRDFFGVVPQPKANCDWFDATQEEGYNLFYHYGDERHLWTNGYNHDAVLTPDALTIEHNGIFCNLNNVTFEKRCDGCDPTGSRFTSTSWS